MWGTRFGPRPNTDSCSVRAASQDDATVCTAKQDSRGVSSPGRKSSSRARARRMPTDTTNIATLEYMPASVAAARGISKKRGKPPKFGDTEKFVPGEGVLRLGVPPPAACAENVIVSTSPSSPKRAKTRKEDGTASHAPSIQPVVPVCHPSAPPDATARAKPRHSNDPVVVQNKQHRRRRVIVPEEQIRQRYAASLRLPPISGPQHGPLPSIGAMTGAFKYFRTCCLTGIDGPC